MSRWRRPVQAKGRTLAIVHNNIDARSSIGAIAAWQVSQAIDRGWQVTAICRDLDPALAPHVAHRPLYVPPRAHLLQYAVARPTLRAALSGWRPDVLLVHQPQLAAMADLWNVHYLSRAARLSRGPAPRTMRGRVHDAQAAGVALIEDRYLRRLPRSTRVLFCSDGLRDQFADIYGDPENATVLYNPTLLPTLTPGRSLPDPELRAAIAGDHEGPVIGFLGGGDPRKGGDLILDAVEREQDLFLVHAGPTRLDDSRRGVRGRTRCLGYLSDVTELLDAVDVLAVPSRFEPFGLVVPEAVSRGVPVVLGERVGSAAMVVAAGAGLVWNPSTPLTPLVRRLVDDRNGVIHAGRRIADVLSPSRIADQLFGELDEVLERKRGGSP
jgi:glycosyltransferase involved in cell wall biosynthesis